MKKPYRNRKPHGCNCTQNHATAVMVSKRDYDVLVGKAALLDTIKTLVQMDEKYTAVGLLEKLYKK